MPDKRSYRIFHLKGVGGMKNSDFEMKGDRTYALHLRKSCPTVCGIDFLICKEITDYFR